MITNNVDGTNITDFLNLTDYLKTYSNLSSHEVIEKTASTVKDCWHQSIPTLVTLPEIKQIKEAAKSAILSVHSIQTRKINRAFLFAMSSYLSLFQATHKMLIPQDLLAVESIQTGDMSIYGIG